MFATRNLNKKDQTSILGKHETVNAQQPATLPHRMHCTAQPMNWKSGGNAIHHWNWFKMYHSCRCCEWFVKLNLVLVFHGCLVATRTDLSLWTLVERFISCLFLESAGWVILCYEITLSSHHSEASAPQGTEKTATSYCAKVAALKKSPHRLKSKFWPKIQIRILYRLLEQMEFYQHTVDNLDAGCMQTMLTVKTRIWRSPLDSWTSDKTLTWWFRKRAWQIKSTWHLLMHTNGC